jgi:hypothetical protein
MKGHDLFTQGLPVRRLRLRMGAGRPLSDAAARAQLARGVQRAALRGEDRRSVALDAQRPATLGSRLSSGAALAGGRLLRATGRRVDFH